MRRDFVKSFQISRKNSLVDFLSKLIYNGIMQRRALGLQMRRHSFVNHNHTPFRVYAFRSGGLCKAKPRDCVDLSQC